MGWRVINANTAHKNRHTLYLGQNGSGKSQALLQNPEFKKARAKIVFDPNLDHSGAIAFRSLADFGLALVQARRSRKPFYLAYCPPRVQGKAERVACHEKFCQYALLALDGRADRLFIADEELAGSCRSAAEADPFHKVLITQGRKYGAVYHGVAQRPQDIPKVIFDECKVFYVGSISERAVDYTAQELKIPAENISALQPLEFIYLDKSTGHPSRKIKIKYKK